MARQWPNWATISFILLSTLPMPSSGQNSSSGGGGMSSSGLDTFFLIKSHAVLMTLAWVLFAPLAILFARFQKDPLRRLLGEQLWFQVHRLANTLTVLCALLAFVCILSALGGHWVGPRVGAQVDWAAMHAIFGLVAVLLALGQPFSALFRCHPDSSSRQVFNIWHGLSGYFAWFCAAVALSIACVHFHTFASPTAAVVLLIVFLTVLPICFCLMQFVAVQKAQLQIGNCLNQPMLYATAAILCTCCALAISLLVIFA